MEYHTDLLAVRDYELNELLIGFFDIRSGGESASA